MSDYCPDCPDTPPESLSVQFTPLSIEDERRAGLENISLPNLHLRLVRVTEHAKPVAWCLRLLGLVGAAGVRPAGARYKEQPAVLAGEIGRRAVIGGREEILKAKVV